MSFQKGDLINDQYRVERIFTGGMGRVYVALDEILGKRFAIKQLPQQHLDKNVMVERFRREASSWCLLGYHPNIVQAHSFLPRSDGPMLILEFVDGPSLEWLLRSLKKLSPFQICDYAKQFCKGMHFAQTSEIANRGVGLLHRDIKPGNILLTKSNRVKITDFGLAKVEGEDTISGEGLYVGTLAYSSPEQLRKSNAVTRASDVYSFGAVMYQMICGTAPFRAKTPSDYYQLIVKVEPAPLGEQCPHISEELIKVVHRCLSKDPQARYQDFSELTDAMDNLMVFRHQDDWDCPECGFVHITELERCPLCLSKSPSTRTDNRETVGPGTQGPILPDLDSLHPIVIPEDEDQPLPVGGDDSQSSSGSQVFMPGQGSSVAPDAPMSMDSLNLDEDGCYLVELRPDGQITPWELKRSWYSVGRSSKMRIRLRDPKIAGYQLFMARMPFGWVLTNPRSNDSLEVNGKPTTDHLLEHGDLIRIGATWLAFMGRHGEQDSVPALKGRWHQNIDRELFTARPTVESHRRLCTLEIPGGQVVETTGRPLMLGRSPTCDLTIDGATTGLFHAVIVWRNNRPQLFNLKTTDLKIVGGREILHHRLREGELIQAGSTIIKVAKVQVTPIPNSGSDRPQVIAIAALSERLRGNTALTIPETELVIGRHQSCGILIDTDKYVSRRHIRLTSSPFDIEIQDLGSRHGFFVNHRKCQTRTRASIGDIITIGKTQLLLHHQCQNIDAEALSAVE